MVYRVSSRTARTVTQRKLVSENQSKKKNDFLHFLDHSDAWWLRPKEGREVGQTFGTSVPQVPAPSVTLTLFFVHIVEEQGFE